MPAVIMAGNGLPADMLQVDHSLQPDVAQMSLDSPGPECIGDSRR